MSFYTRLSNRLSGAGQSLSNSIRGIGDPGWRFRYSGGSEVSLSSGDYVENLRDLDDLILVERTLKNARRAVEIDPTTWSSLISLVTIANKSFEIMGEKDVHPAALDHIKGKRREWDLDKRIDELLWKSMEDGECFLRKHLQGKSIESINFLAYDQNDYDFLALPDPKTGEVLGYKQKATVYNVPSNWREETFDTLANPTPETVETPFEVDEIIHPKLFEKDGRGQSMVFKVLDFVYIKRQIENMMPVAARRAAVTLGVQVGNEDVKFTFGAESGDSAVEKQSKMAEAMGSIGSNFAEKEKKDLVVFPFGVVPKMIGDGRLVEFTDYLDYLKQEIRTALLTPDSRFESKSSNRAVAREQLSGALGQVTVVEYLRDFVKSYLEPELFDHELELAGYGSEKGKVFIKFTELELEDEQILAQIAEKLMVLGADPEVIIQTYFKRYVVEEQNYTDKPVRYPPMMRGGTPQPPINEARSMSADGGLDPAVRSEMLNSLREQFLEN